MGLQTALEPPTSNLNFRRREAERGLRDSAEELESLIRTMPPDSFLEMYADLFNSAFKTLDAGQEDATPEEISEALRADLRTLATLLQKFDGDPPNQSYSANIMVVRDFASLEDSEKEQLCKRMLSGKEFRKEHLCGALNLRKDLSTRADSTDAEEDDSLEPLVLPLPRDRRDRVLPGAPLAYFEKKMLVCDDTKSLPDWCRKNGDFLQSEIEDFEQYLNKARNDFCSFASIPLFTIDSEGKDMMENSPFAILNLHRRDPGLLGGRGTETARTLREVYQLCFQHILRPFLVITIHLLLRLLRAEREANKKSVDGPRLHAGNKARG